MIKIGPKYDKLKTNLQLAINRLKLVQSKTQELVQKLKLEIVNCVKNEKFMNARIKAQKLIRDEATVEALELVELYCEQLLERYELFRQWREPDESLLIPISNLIWVAPYYQTHIKELKFISKQLVVKYGPRFCRLALLNKNGNVSSELIERVKHKSSDDQIENSLITACKKYGIDYEKIEQERLNSKKMHGGLLRNNENLGVSDSAEIYENNELVAEGMGQINNKISSKKAFNEIMSKNKAKMSSNQDECIEKISSSENALDKCAPEAFDGDLSNIRNYTLTEKSNKCINYTESISSAKYCENGSTEVKQSGITSLGAECTCWENIVVIQSSDTCKSHSCNRELNPYPEPPPPYNELTFDSSESKEPVYPSLQPLQLPTCPTEPADDKHANCKIRKKEKELFNSNGHDI